MGRSKDHKERCFMGFSVDGPTFQQIDTVEKWNKIYGSAASEGMLHSALAYNLSWRLSCAQFLHDLTQRSAPRPCLCAQLWRSMRSGAAPRTR